MSGGNASSIGHEVARRVTRALDGETLPHWRIRSVTSILAQRTSGIAWHKRRRRAWRTLRGLHLSGIF